MSHSEKNIPCMDMPSRCLNMCIAKCSHEKSHKTFGMHCVVRQNSSYFGHFVNDQIKSEQNDLWISKCTSETCGFHSLCRVLNIDAQHLVAASYLINTKQIADYISALNDSLLLIRTCFFFFCKIKTQYAFCNVQTGPSSVDPIDWSFPRKKIQDIATFLTYMPQTVNKRYLQSSTEQQNRSTASCYATIPAPSWWLFLVILGILSDMSAYIWDP